MQEPFAPGQQGSSAMPHKRNRVRCERVTGLARLIRGNLQVALENTVLWHERDISHSSAERVILPDSTMLLDFMLAEATEVLDGDLFVFAGPTSDAPRGGCRRRTRRTRPGSHHQRIHRAATDAQHPR